MSSSQEERASEGRAWPADARRGVRDAGVCEAGCVHAGERAHVPAPLCWRRTVELLLFRLRRRGGSCESGGQPHGRGRAARTRDHTRAHAWAWAGVGAAAEAQWVWRACRARRAAKRKKQKSEIASHGKSPHGKSRLVVNHHTKYFDFYFCGYTTMLKIVVFLFCLREREQARHAHRASRTKIKENKKIILPSGGRVAHLTCSVVDTVSCA